jgi:molybdopterin converting factor small subunit
MVWRVLLFAHLKENHGEWVEIESEPTVRGVFDALQRAGIDTRSSRLAANDRFLGQGDAIPPGAELALIPPVSGG